MTTPSMPARDRYDVTVVGARAAGAATAMLLARGGARVLALDRGRYGSDTLSTLALMRGGVLQLARWGVLDGVRAAGTPVVRRTTFHYGGEAVPVDIRPVGEVDGLYAPRRTVLDALLVDAAREAGAEVVHGVAVSGLRIDAGGRVGGVEIEGPEGSRRAISADLVIGADGRLSRVAEQVGAGVERRARQASGVVYGFWQGLEPDGYHWLYAPGVSAGVIPTNDGASLVFATAPGARFLAEAPGRLGGFFERVLGEVSPELAGRVARARRVGSLHGFPGVPGFLRRAGGPGWALVGDAGYFKDPITAHGLTDALRDAELLARAVLAGGEDALAGYQEQRDELSADLFEITDAIAAYDWTLDEVQQLHRRLSDSMKAEVAELRDLDALPVPRIA